MLIDLVFEVWCLSIHLRPDKIESHRNLPKQQMKRHLLWDSITSCRWGGLMGIGRHPTDDKNEVIAMQNFESNFSKIQFLWDWSPLKMIFSKHETAPRFIKILERYFPDSKDISEKIHKDTFKKILLLENRPHCFRRKIPKMYLTIFTLKPCKC